MRQQSLSVNYTDITANGNLMRSEAASRADSQHFADTMELKWHKRSKILCSPEGSHFAPQNKEDYNVN